MSSDARMYFMAMKYVYVDEKTQDQWIEFHLSYLKHSSRRTKNEVIAAHLEALTNLARQINYCAHEYNRVSQVRTCVYGMHADLTKKQLNVL